MTWGQTVDSQAYIRGMTAAAANADYIKTLSDTEIMLGIEAHGAKGTDYSRGVAAYLEIVLGDRGRASA